MDLSSPITIDTVWEKGLIAKTLAPEKWRYDECGSLIKYDEYGNRDSDYGWEIDHIVRPKDGGSNDLSNLRPLQWENNVKRN